MWSRLWITIDRWGPAATAGICLAVVAVVGWYYSSRISYLHGVTVSQQSQIEHQDEMHKREMLSLRTERKQELDKLRDEVTGLRNWSIAVYERGSQGGFNLPNPPKEKKDE
jgi:hypothetical protein